MADTGFRGTVAEFIDCADCNLLVETISGNLARGSESEWWSWRDGLQKLANDLRLASRDDNYSWIRELTIVCELCFTGSRHRADIVLGGMGLTGSPCLLVLEAKQWSSDSVGINEDDSNYVIANAYRDVTSRQLHPILQARGYASSLEISEALQNAQVLSGAYLPNMRAGNPAIEERSIRREDQDFLVLLDGSTNLRDILSRLFSRGDESGVISQIIEDAEFVFSNPTEYDVSPDESTGDEWLEEDEGEEHESMSSMVSSEQVFDGLGYHGTREQFIELCDRNLIAHIIRDSLGVNMRETTSEFRSWREGLYRLARVLRDVDLPIHVACEVRSQAGMIDVVLGGISAETVAPAFLVIELKQWSELGILNDPDDWMLENGIIRAHVGGPSVRATSHPSWQANRYTRGLRNYKMYFQDYENIIIHGMAYLPNVTLPETSAISDERYYNTDSAYPSIFYGSSTNDFANFLNGFFAPDQSDNLLEMIRSPHGTTRYITEQVEDLYIRGMNGDLENSMLVPSAEQQRSIHSIIDSLNSNESRQVHLVQGGPGTGKTIVGLYVFFSQFQIGSNICYFAGNNPTPRVLRERLADLPNGRNLEESILTGGELDRRMRGLCEEGPMDLLIVDESQSHNRAQQGRPPLLTEIIRSARNVVFMFDERQSINYNDKVGVGEIQEAVDQIQQELEQSIEVLSWRLNIQQRSGQVSNLLPFVGNLLGYDGEVMPDRLVFDIIVHDTATSMGERILQLNDSEEEEAALMASYCWEFISRGPEEDNPNLWDIELDGGEFRRKWNREGGKNKVPFMEDPTRNLRAGFAPEMQGQELQYAGLIIGPDLEVRDGEIAFNLEQHHVESPVFGSVKGEDGKSRRIQQFPDRLEQLLRNQYWILFTRATRELHLYSEDPEVRDFLRQRISELQD